MTDFNQMRRQIFITKKNWEGQFNWQKGLIDKLGLQMNDRDREPEDLVGAAFFSLALIILYCRWVTQQVNPLSHCEMS